MTVEQTNVIDFTTVDSKTRTAFLNISDHLPWDEKGLHLKLLQDKLNAYLSCIESGQLQQEVPETTGYSICIRILGKFPLNEQAKLFMEMATPAVREVGVDLQFTLFEAEEESGD
jgi:hypothetical protein